MAANRGAIDHGLPVVGEAPIDQGLQESIQMPAKTHRRNLTYIEFHLE